ncbi:hypothetical protein [Peribacillus frigoritolerans]|nr:hypothetical protein [Peribacillus frigoritolerans]
MTATHAIQPIIIIMESAYIFKDLIKNNDFDLLSKGRQLTAFYG